MHEKRCVPRCIHILSFELIGSYRQPFTGLELTHLHAASDRLHLALLVLEGSVVSA